MSSYLSIIIALQSSKYHNLDKVFLLLMVIKVLSANNATAEKFRMKVHRNMQYTKHLKT